MSDLGLEQHLAEMKERRLELERWCSEALATFKEKRIVVVESGHLFFALHRSSRKDVNFQVSWWSDGEPSGHRDHQDFDEAAKDLFYERPRSSGEPDQS